MSGTLIIGGGGMIGQKLARALADDPLTRKNVTLFDMGFPTDGAKARQVIGNVTDTAAIKALIAERPHTIFHLAAIVSGEAEQDYDKGWAVNMMSFWHFLEAIRAEQTQGGPWRPRIVFSSSIAVFGAPFPEAIDDEFLSAPHTSYGAQKATCELMLSDLTRRGVVDGISIRLPTICVRPGKPNAAASGFFSGIIREPLNEQPAVLPVSTETRHWHASPRSAVGFLRHAAALNPKRLEGRYALNMPGLSCTVEEQIEALRQVAGNKAVERITYKPDPDVQAIVRNWPRRFKADRAFRLGFTAERNFREIIDIYIAEEMSSAPT